MKCTCITILFPKILQQYEMDRRWRWRWIFGQKSSKLWRFFDNLKWTEDEDEDGSSAKNLRRTKIFEASLQHCFPCPSVISFESISQFSVDRVEFCEFLVDKGAQDCLFNEHWGGVVNVVNVDCFKVLQSASESQKLFDLLNIFPLESHIDPVDTSRLSSNLIEAYM